MTPDEFNFPAQRRGDTFNGYILEINLNGSPVNLTGAVITIQFRRKPGTTPVLQWLTSDNSITISGAGNNLLTMATKTGLQMNVEPGTYMYDIDVLLANGVTNTYVYGTMPIVNDISRPL